MIDLNEISIRETGPEELFQITTVETLAFGYDKEARLTAELLTDKSAASTVSLLAFYRGEAVGHILFTRARFGEREEQPLMHILAPLAVIPQYQGQGVGGMLIKTGIRLLKEKGSNLVFVLGHPHYYPKYGFIPHAARLGFEAPYPIPEPLGDCWMVQPVGRQEFNACRGKIKCADVLNRPEHWRDDASDR